MKEKIQNNWGTVFVAGAILLSLLYLLFNGGHYYTEIHDALDGINESILSDNHLFFAHAVQVPMMDGLDRDYMVSELHLQSWIYMILPSLQAYWMCMYTKVLLAVAGWILLFRQIIGGGGYTKSQRNIIVVCGFLYGILPVYPEAAIAFGALPLLLALLISIYRRPAPFKFLLLFLYPMLSNFQFFGIFVCGYILLFCMGCLIGRKPARHMWLALLVIAVGYIACDYRLFYIMLVHPAPTIRDEMKPAYYSFAKVLEESLKVFVKGHYHSGTLHQYSIVPACGVYFLYLNAGYLYRQEIKKMLRDPFNHLILWAAFNSFVYGLQGCRLVNDAIALLVPALKGFQINRTAWFSPFAWTMAFSLLLLRMAQTKRKAGNILPCALLFAAVLVVPLKNATYNDVYYNTSAIVKTVQHQENNMATWQDFFSEELFTEIKEAIDYDGEKVIAFGYHPAVLSHNGFYTLDGYLSYYPLAYKYEFAKLIAPLLEASAYYNDYYLNWGGRAYVFPETTELRRNWNMPTTPSALLIDPDVFRQMGGKYVLSCLEITNTEDLGLKCIGTWGSDASFYTIRVYEMSS